MSTFLFANESLSAAIVRAIADHERKASETGMAD